MQLFNINTGQYFTPEPHTLQAWKEGRRPFLIHLISDKKAKILQWEQKLNYAKDFTPHKVSYYQALLDDAKKDLLTPYCYSPLFDK